MKDVPQRYIQSILDGTRFIGVHLYIFTSATGEKDYFTDADIPVQIFSGQVYRAGELNIDGLRRKLSFGLEVDEQEVKIWASPTATLFGAQFLQGAQEGLLDGCYLVRRRVVWQVITGNLAYDMRVRFPLANWVLFGGYFGEITKGGATHIEVKVRSALAKLEVNMPRNYYQPGCLWTLYDSGCTLNQADFTVHGTLSSPGSQPNLIMQVAGGISHPTGADGLPTYAQGRMLWTSGVNSGLLVSIGTNDSTALYLQYPVVNIPSPGDKFQYWPGCSKTLNTCTAKFNNTTNFRGFDLVPPVMLSI